MRLAKLAENRLVFVNGIGEGTFFTIDIDQERRLVFPLQYTR